MTTTTPTKRGRGRPKKGQEVNPKPPKPIVLPDLPDNPDRNLPLTRANATISTKHSSDPTTVGITIQPESEHLPVPVDDRKVKFITVARAERFWIDKARKDPAFFCHYLLGKAPAKHHLIWLKDIFDYTSEGKQNGSFRLNLIAPRDSAKSTIAVMALTWFMSRFPFTSNAIISVSSSQSEKRIEMVRDFVAYDPRYRNIFPHIYVDNNQRNNIHEFSLAANGMFDINTGLLKPIGYNAFRSLVKRIGSGKDPSLYCAGVGGKGVIGRRISGIMLLDDIIDETYLKSDMQDEIYEYMMRTLIPCIMDNAKVINIGTRWMPDDVPQKLKENPEWKTIEIQAIRHAEDGTPLSYWPEYWPLEKLEAKRREMDNDALFRVMYLNDPTAFSDAKFTIEGLSNPLPKVIPKLTQIVVGTDFAISTKSAADFSVFTAVGLDEAKNLYILDMRRIKVTPDVLVTELGNFCAFIVDKFGKLDRVLVEKVAFQTSINFMMKAKYPHIPLEPIPPIGDKGHRATQFAERSNQGRVYYNTTCEAYRQLKSEAMNFGLMGMKDDCIDSISIVVQYLASSIQNVKVRMIKSPVLRL